MSDQGKVMLSGFLVGCLMVILPPLMLPLSIVYLTWLRLWDDHGIRIEKASPESLARTILSEHDALPCTLDSLPPIWLHKPLG